MKMPPAGWYGRRMGRFVSTIAESLGFKSIFVVSAAAVIRCRWCIRFARVLRPGNPFGGPGVSASFVSVNSTPFVTGAAYRFECITGFTGLGPADSFIDSSHVTGLITGKPGWKLQRICPDRERNLRNLRVPFSYSANGNDESSGGKTGEKVSTYRSIISFPFCLLLLYDPT